VAVHVGHLELVLEVGDRAEAAQYHAHVLGLRVVDEEPLEAVHLHAIRVEIEIHDGLADHLHPLFDREQGLLLLVVENGHRNLVERHEAAP